MKYAFVVYDAESSKLIGGICYDEGVYSDSEAAYVATCAQYQGYYPERELHVEEITSEEHARALGRHNG